MDNLYFKIKAIEEITGWVIVGVPILILILLIAYAEIYGKFLDNKRIKTYKN